MAPRRAASARRAGAGRQRGRRWRQAEGAVSAGAKSKASNNAILAPYPTDPDRIRKWSRIGPLSPPCWVLGAQGGRSTCGRSLNANRYMARSGQPLAEWLPKDFPPWQDVGSSLAFSSGHDGPLIPALSCRKAPTAPFVPNGGQGRQDRAPPSFLSYSPGLSLH